MMVLLLAQAVDVATQPVTWPEAFMKVGCALAIALAICVFIKHA